MADNSVGYSRAGDAFHYRWAARRSLKLIYPNSPLFKITVEGTDDENKAGELVIDLAEYYGDEVLPTKIIYYQLKHTTTQKNKPFLISGLKETFEGFAEKFLVFHKKRQMKKLEIQFSIITNRPCDQKFKNNIIAVAAGTCGDKRFLNTLTSYTRLKPEELKLFCSILKIEDAHQDYDLQKKELRIEMMQLMAGNVDNNQLRSLSSAIADKVLPDSNGILHREDVLNSFGIYSDLELYPAEPVWDPSGSVINRSQYEELTSEIFASTNPVLIYAPGGVGKSVFTRQLLDNIQEGSVAIAYDCFGAGKYRNRSQSRHRHREALVQIANELATKGLCDPLLILNGDDEMAITRTFLKRIKSAVDTIKLSYPDGLLVILIDAADNAEMAAKEMADSCFASELLQEEIPPGCKLVYLCRPERIELLHPSSKIARFELSPFNLQETKENLKIHFPGVTDAQAVEFHRLTSGNPRVQANALDTRSNTVEELLNELGPFVKTVEAQIEQQLENALEKLKGTLTTQFQEQIDKICMGLARLSPHIPLDILAGAAGVEVSMVKSFVSEIGRSLWLSDESVQFRDEPTETWFREKFIAKRKDFENYILLLEPLAGNSSYAAQVLPQLYLQAEQYDKLIKIALSDEFLPSHNPVDARNIRVYRLQFALKAALRVNQIKDACMLALRAGEEVAGNERQTVLLKQNIDLLVRLQDKEKVQSMAMRREVRGWWEGSENVFSASLLSSIKEFQGEARGFLRSAENWLNIYFKTPKEKQNYQQEDLRENDLMEIAYAKLNLDGADACMKFLTKLLPKSLIARVFANLIKRLIDLRDSKNIGLLLAKCKNESLFIIESNSKLLEVGQFCDKPLIEDVLKKVSTKELRFKKASEQANDEGKESLIALLETAVHYGLPGDQIRDFIDENLNCKAGNLLTHSLFKKECDYFLRTVALRVHVDGRDNVDMDTLFGSEKGDKKLSYDEQRKINDGKEVLGGLLPWYIARIELIANGGIIDSGRIEELAKRSKKVTSGRYQMNDPITETLPIVLLDILKFAHGSASDIIESFFVDYIEKITNISVGQWISTVRWSHRLDHLAPFNDRFEQKAYEQIKADKSSGPDVLSEYYISLSRAVLNTSADNAVVYFEDAIDIISKVGDEMLRRWDAVVPLAKRTAERQHINPELSNRFLRIAELIGQDTRDKHWDREGALQIAVRLSPTDGIASLSRWREREFGPFGGMMFCLLSELIESADMNPVESWCFTEFCSGENLQYALRMFLKSNKITRTDKIIITEAAVPRLRSEIILTNYWYELHDLLEQQNIKSRTLEKIIAQLPNTNRTKSSEPYPEAKDHMPEIDWETVFSGNDLLNPDGITRANDVLKKLASEKEIHIGRHVFSIAVIKKLKDIELVPYLENLLQCNWIEIYDVSSFFEKLPRARTLRPAFQKKMESIIEYIGSRFALELTSAYNFDMMTKALPDSVFKAKWLLQGIFKGLMTTQEFATAENLFDLVQLAAPSLAPEEASTTLDYALTRFEQHIENDFGDGPWSPSLETDQSLTKALAKFLVTALASPVSKTRWSAAHVLKKLAEHNRIELFDEVYCHVTEKNADSFGCQKYPYYNLHALQYLMIASARISLQFPEKLKPHAQFFLKYAVNFEHAIIQRFAADTAMEIEKAFPGCYLESEIAKLINVIHPKILAEISKEEVDEHTDFDGYDEDNQDEPEAVDFHFGYDFNRYWLAELGEVFGLSQKAMVDVASAVVVNEWNRHEDAYDDDPRLELWNDSRSYHRTAHDHYSYPKDDNFLFYLSYHSMMTVAARLIKNVPMAKSRWDEENPWTEWISRHLNTRSDGYWIVDWKDPLPIIRPDYASLDFGSWQIGLEDDDFVRCLTHTIDGEIYVNVSGTWQEIVDHKSEKYYITSSLVNPDTSDSLMRALETCDDPYNFKLPNYEDENVEIRKSPFELTGWIVENDMSPRLDENDSRARGLPLPPYEIGQAIANKLGLVKGHDGKSYFIRDSNIGNVISSALWASTPPSQDEEPEQKGMCMRASLNFLKTLCREMKKELILEVQIQRNYYSSHRSGRDKEYKPAIHKIFILSEDGTIRNTERNYQIG